MSTIIVPTDPALTYSPDTWHVTPSGATTINAGATLSTVIAGTLTCGIQVAAGVTTPYSEIDARLNGGAWQPFSLSASPHTLQLTMPTTAAPTYVLDIVVKATTETQDRWTTQATAVTISGLVLDNGATVTAPAARAYRIRVHGDSITEGVRVYGTSAPLDVDRNDNTQDYSGQLATALNALVSIDGFGGTGLTRGGSGNVPALPQSYNYLWNGQRTPLTSPYDAVLYAEGRNDTAAPGSIQAALTGVINAYVVLGTPVTRQVILSTLDPTLTAVNSALQATAAATGAVFVDATSWVNLGTDTSDGIHPLAAAHLQKIAPPVIAALRAVLPASAPVGAPPPPPPAQPGAPIVYTPAPHDSSDAMPDGGYLFALLPRGWVSSDAPTARAVLSILDQSLETARLAIGALRAAHGVGTALGPDLDDIGAILGVARLSAEGDALYRPRIPAACAPIPTDTAYGLAAWLTAITGLGVSLANGYSPMTGAITFQGLPPQGVSLVPLILGRLPFGARVSITANAPQVTGRLGAFRLGAATLGGGPASVTFYTPPATAATATSRLGAFRLGAARL